MLEFRHAIILQVKSHRVWSRQSIEWSSSGHSAISYSTKHDRSGQNNGIRECFRGRDSNPKVCLHIFYSPINQQSKFLRLLLYTNSRYTYLTSPLSGSSVLFPRFRFSIYHWHCEKKKEKKGRTNLCYSVQIRIIYFLFFFFCDSPFMILHCSEIELEFLLHSRIYNVKLFERWMLCRSWVQGHLADKEILRCVYSNIQLLEY